jgi:phage terminase large subunit-like protein
MGGGGRSVAAARQGLATHALRAPRRAATAHHRLVHAEARKFFVKLVHDKATVTTHGTMDDNPYLAESVGPALYDQYGGTSLGAQELLGQIVSDVKGAITTRDRLDEVRLWEHPKLSRRIVMVDPAITFTEDSDETGITMQDRAGDHVYLLADVSIKAPVEEWAMKAIEAAVEWGVRCGLLRGDPGLGHPRRGAASRAQAVRAAWDQPRAHD